MFKKIFDVLRLVFYAKFRPKLSLHSIPVDQGFNKSKSTLPKDATTQVTAFMGFKKIFKDFFLKRESKFDTPIWPHPVPRDHGWNVSTQVSAFQLLYSNSFWENRFLKTFFLYYYAKIWVPPPLPVLLEFFVLCCCDATSRFPCKLYRGHEGFRKLDQ